MAIPRGEGRRRFSPRPWHHDWYVLRELRAAIEPAVRELLASRTESETVVVDVGAGEAPYRSLFERVPGVRYVTSDIEGAPDLRVDEQGRVPLADAAADLVVSFQVLEHVEDVSRYLGECRRLLRGGGRMLLSTHGTWLYHPHPTDFRRWTREGLISDLGRAGFGIESIRAVVGPLAWTTQFRLFGFRSALIRVPLLGAALTALLSMVMNARMVVEDRITPHGVREDNPAVYVVLARRTETSG
jgi:SAM-dependent methyltransferase